MNMKSYVLIGLLIFMGLITIGCSGNKQSVSSKTVPGQQRV